jgi:hypothetical protein
MPGIQGRPDCCATWKCESGEIIEGCVRATDFECSAEEKAHAHTSSEDEAEVNLTRLGSHGPVHYKFEEDRSVGTSSPFMVARCQVERADLDDVSEAAHMYRTAELSARSSVKRCDLSFVWAKMWPLPSISSAFGMSGGSASPEGDRRVANLQLSESKLVWVALLSRWQDHVSLHACVHIQGQPVKWLQHPSDLSHVQNISGIP